MRKHILLVFVVCQSLCLHAQTESSVVMPQMTDTAHVALPWPENLQARLDSLTNDRFLERTQLGLMIYDLSADSVLYRYGEKQTLRPASTMKLLTAITALDCLGADYPLRTSLYYRGVVNGRTLEGDVFLVGGMDPMFDEVDMEIFAEAVRRMGVDSIRGRIVTDTSFKEEFLLGEGWCWDDDNPQLTPLLVSRKDEFASRFVSMLRDKGLAVDAPCTSGILPKDVLLVCSRSHRLKDILVPMMKESDNLYAESMFFQIAASSGARPAKATHARQIIKRTVGKSGITGVAYRVADGSGLSLYNYVTPELMVSMLRYAYLHRDIISYLRPSLPVAAVDGTLKKRMGDSCTKGRVQAKTGTVTGVSSLAGYCTAANGHQLAFCIINQGAMKNTEARAYQDKVCEALCRE